MGFPGGAGRKEHSNQCRRLKRYGFDPWMGKIPLEKGMATHSSMLAWKIPWTEEPDGLQRVVHNWATEHSPNLSVLLYGNLPFMIFPQYSLTIKISWHHGSGWMSQCWVDSMAHTTGRWNTAVVDSLCLSVDGSTVKTLESLQIYANRNWKLTSCNQNGNLSTGLSTVSEEDIWFSSE